MRTIIFALMFFVARVASAQVVINEIQVSPIGDRFIELYNSGNSNIDLTGWYIQRKTSTGTSFSSLVTSTQFKDKIVKANSYFLVSRNPSSGADITIDNLTLTEANSLRVRDSKGSDIDQAEWGAIGEGKSYQRITASEWVIAFPTPGLANSGGTNPAPQEVSTSITQSAVTTPSSSSAFPIEPQIFADAGVATRVVSTGAPITFAGRVFGLKKEPIENARMVWAFGDGGRREGASVTHTYYYPGEYIAVLDAASGYYSASDRVTVRVVAPVLSLRTGGDTMHSFVAIENRGGDEINLSEWQVEANGKIFVLPQNTILGARKTLTLASEVTGLVTPAESLASLHFPNGTRVETQDATPALAVTQISNNSKTIVIAPPTQALKKELVVIKQIPIVAASHISAPQVSVQEASVASTADDIFTTPPVQESGNLWPWYSAAAFLGVLALLGLRMTRTQGANNSLDLTADDFEIMEDEDTKDSIF